MAVRRAAGPVLPFDMGIGTDSDQTWNIGIVTFLGIPFGPLFGTAFGQTLGMNPDPAIGMRLGTTLATLPGPGLGTNKVTALGPELSMTAVPILTLVSGMKDDTISSPRAQRAGY